MIEFVSNFLSKEGWDGGIFAILCKFMLENFTLEVSILYVDTRGGHGGEISRDKTINTINYFPGKFVTIIDKILLRMI